VSCEKREPSDPRASSLLKARRKLSDGVIVCRGQSSELTVPLCPAASL